MQLIRKIKKNLVCNFIKNYKTIMPCYLHRILIKLVNKHN